MRRKQSFAAVLCLALALSLFGCGKKSPQETPPSASPTPVKELSEADMAPVTAMASELTAQQMQLLTDSIEIIPGEAEADGVRAALVSAMGDGCYNSFNIIVELPKAAKDTDWGFGEAEIDFGDPAADFSACGMTCTQLEDDEPGDSKYSLRVVVAASRWNDEGSPLGPDKTRTLRLKNLVSAKGKTLYKGEWSFGFKYMNTGEHRQLLAESVPAPGVSETGAYSGENWAELESLVLSSFSIECRFRVLNGAAAEPSNYGLPYVELKSGQKQLIGCDSQRTEGGCDIRDYFLIIPIEPDDVKSIHLADKLTINID